MSILATFLSVLSVFVLGFFLFVATAIVVVAAIPEEVRQEMIEEDRRKQGKPREPLTLEHIASIIIIDLLFFGAAALILRGFGVI